MRQLDLFTGIGGFALAAERVGWETVGFCETDPFCRQAIQDMMDCCSHLGVTRHDSGGWYCVHCGEEFVQSFKLEAAQIGIERWQAAAKEAESRLDTLEFQLSEFVVEKHDPK